MAQTFNPADLDELVAMLKATDPDGETIRSVSLNPDEVQLPGLWVQLDSLDGETLDRNGLTVGVTVYLIVPAAGGYARQLAGLAELYNLVAPALPGPTRGPVTRASVILPASTTPMPALAVPLDLLTHNEE